MFIFQRERESATEHKWRRERERDTHRNPKQAPGSELSAQSLMAGLELTSCEVMT